MSTRIEEERSAALLDWYAARGRTLPWRESSDPYGILVSEVMLQQTQVDRVLPYFERFMERYPTVHALAGAAFIDVAASWSGLGYNRRARRLHDAAKMIARNGWPHDAAGLASLPGVGVYTAAAVAALAFGESVAAIDTNVRRVLSRWYGEPLTGSALVRIATANLGDADPADWNQALMDLGATLCRPRTPECRHCPVSGWCAGPETYTPPRPQPRFEGSLRQVRGALVRTLVHGERDFEELVAATGFAPDLIAHALDGLIDDGLVDQGTGETYRMAD
jgi:A/G-specific adenine glycosylase